MSKWQPIATAPKDGTILLYLPELDNVISGKRGSGEWWIDCWCKKMEGIYEPSHWMPRPEPPKKEATK